MENKGLELTVKIIVAILLPPAAAFWQVGFGVHFWGNIALTLIAWIPGVAHAIWLILREEDMARSLVWKIILAILLPPAAALWQVGLGVHFWLNLVLTLIAWIPGMVHALWLIFRDRYEVLNIDRPWPASEAY